MPTAQATVIMDWRQYYTTSSTGWMSTRGLDTSMWWCNGVYAWSGASVPRSSPYLSLRCCCLPSSSTIR